MVPQRRRYNHIVCIYNNSERAVLFTTQATLKFVGSHVTYLVLPAAGVSYWPLKDLPY